MGRKLGMLVNSLHRRLDPDESFDQVSGLENRETWRR